MERSVLLAFLSIFLYVRGYVRWVGSRGVAGARRGQGISVDGEGRGGAAGDWRGFRRRRGLGNRDCFSS